MTFAQIIEDALREYDRGVPGMMMTAEDMLLGRSQADRARAMADSVDRGVPGMMMTAEDMLLGRQTGARPMGPRAGKSSARVASALPPMTEQDYYDEEAEQALAEAQEYEARQAARDGAEPARQYDRSGSGDRIRQGQDAMEAVKYFDRGVPGMMMTAEDMLLGRSQADRARAMADSVDRGVPGMMMTAEDMLLGRQTGARDGAEPARQYDRSGSGERIAEGRRQEQWVNTLKADFEVAHGTPYNPDSTMDQAKMSVLAGARRMYPNATATQLALKLYRGEFD